MHTRVIVCMLQVFETLVNMQWEFGPLSFDQWCLNMNLTDYLILVTNFLGLTKPEWLGRQIRHGSCVHTLAQRDQKSLDVLGPIIYFHQ